MRAVQTATTAGSLFGVALNWRSVLEQRQEEFTQPPYQQMPQKPVLFIKTPNTLNYHGESVVQPHGERLQPGPALGVVISRDASRVQAADALEYVAGYVIVNEFSLPEDSYYRPAIKAKCRDGFCAVGQFVLANNVPDPHALTIRLLVNGQVRQTGHTSDWLRPLPQLIAEITEFMTLHAGDILITGTPPGRVDVVAGDNVVVEIDHLGQLHNVIVAEETV